MGNLRFPLELPPRYRENHATARDVAAAGKPAFAEPDDVRTVLERTSGVVGFFGASSMERLPTERAIADQLRLFKSLPV